MVTFSSLLELLADISDPRRAEGKLDKLPYVLLFSILPIVSGSNSYRGIVTFIDVHRAKLNVAFGLTWQRAPAHTAIRYMLQGLGPIAVEAAFRRHAVQLQATCAKPGQGSIALAGKTLRGCFDTFHDRAAAQMLSAFATDTALVLAHVDIADCAAHAKVTLIVQVKDNQRTLLQHCRDIAAASEPLTADCSQTHGRNRDEHRTVSVFDPADDLAGTPWQSHVAAIIQVERKPPVTFQCVAVDRSSRLL